MTPKEKAIELVEKFKNPVTEYPKEENIYYNECALIAVDEIIKSNPFIDITYNKYNCSWIEKKSNVEYWQEVKQEIEKL